MFSLKNKTFLSALALFFLLASHEGSASRFHDDFTIVCHLSVNNQGVASMSETLPLHQEFYAHTMKKTGIYVNGMLYDIFSKWSYSDETLVLDEMRLKNHNDNITVWASSNDNEIDGYTTKADRRLRLEHSGNNVLYACFYAGL